MIPLDIRLELDKELDLDGEQNVCSQINWLYDVVDRKYHLKTPIQKSKQKISHKHMTEKLQSIGHNNENEIYIFLCTIKVVRRIYSIKS